MPKGNIGVAPNSKTDEEILNYFAGKGVSRVETSEVATRMEPKLVEVPPYNPVVAYRQAQTLEEKVAVLARKVLGIRPQGIEIIRPQGSQPPAGEWFYCPNRGKGCDRRFDQGSGITGHLLHCKFKEGVNGHKG